MDPTGNQPPSTPDIVEKGLESVIVHAKMSAAEAGTSIVANNRYASQLASGPGAVGDGAASPVLFANLGRVLLDAS